MSKRNLWNFVIREIEFKSRDRRVVELNSHLEDNQKGSLDRLIKPLFRKCNSVIITPTVFFHVLKKLLQIQKKNIYILEA